MDQLPALLEALGAQPGRYVISLRGQVTLLEIEHATQTNAHRAVITVTNLGSCIDLASLLPAPLVEVALTAPTLPPVQLPAPVAQPGAPPADVKHCSACNQDKPTETFGVDRSRPDGRMRLCKPCYNAKNQQKRAAQRSTDPAPEVAASSPF